MEEVREVRMTLRVLDGETKESRIVDIEETENWDWKNPEVWRVIGGWQITSYEMLVAVLLRKAEQGIEEVEMLEAPRFTMLSGG